MPSSAMASQRTDESWLQISPDIQVLTVRLLTQVQVFKGKKMPGQMGNKQVTIQNLEVVKVDAENNLLLVKGAQYRDLKKSLVKIKRNRKVSK